MWAVWNYRVFLPPPAAVVIVLVAVLVVVGPQTTTTTGPPYIMRRPQNRTVVEGQRVYFTCGAEAFPGNVTTYWYKDGTDVRQLDVYLKGRMELDGESLVITAVVKEDMGWYMCRPFNSIGDDEAMAYLNVTYLPKVMANLMPVKVNWAKGYRERLDCPVDANPPMTNTTWTKGQLIIGSRGRFDVLLNGTLLVTNVGDGDAGSYSCTPVSAVGQGSPSPNVQVIVRDPPHFVLRPQALYQRQVGQSVFMACVAAGTPTPSIAWTKNPGVLNLADRRISLQGGNLSISNTTKEDHGRYQCVASNTIRTVISEAELRILNTTPHAPYNVTVIPGLFSAEVSWSPAYDGGRPQFYMLWFRQPGGQWDQLQVPNGGSTFTVYGLHPATKYEFMVLSRNTLGNGSYSEVKEATTLGYHADLVTALPTDASGVTFFPDVIRTHGPNPTPARNVSAVVVGDNVIVVSWLPAVHSPVPVFWYQVNYRLAGSSRWISYPKKVGVSAGTRLDMDDLDPGVYQIRVIAYGVMAFSMPSNIAIADTSREDQMLPDAMIGGIIGGVLFLLVAVLLTTMAIIHSRRKDSKARNGHTNYADVSYGKPEDMNSLHRQAAPERHRWQPDGGGDVVTSITKDDSIFFLPRSKHPDTNDLHQHHHHHPYNHNLNNISNNNNSSSRRRSSSTLDVKRPTAHDPQHQDQDHPLHHYPHPRYNDPHDPISNSRRPDLLSSPSPYNRPHPQHPHPPPYYYRDPESRRPSSSGRYSGPGSPLGSQPLVFSDDTLPLVTSAAPPRPRSRSHPSERSHRFPSDPYDPRSPVVRDAPPLPAPFAYPPPHHHHPHHPNHQDPYRPEYPHNHPHPYHHPPAPPRDSFLPPSQPPPPYRSSGGSGGSDVPPKKPSRVHDLPSQNPPHHHYYYDGPYREHDDDTPAPYRSNSSLPAAPTTATGADDLPPRGGGGPGGGYEGPFHSFQDEEEDDVFPTGGFPPHPHPHHPQSSVPHHQPHAVFPRHSSMKPGAAPPPDDVLGDGEDGVGAGLDEGDAPGFTLGDISSVLDPPQEQDQDQFREPSPPPPALPPPRRSWQPSQESSRSVPPSFHDSSGWDPSRESDRSRNRERDPESFRAPRDRDRDRPLARVWPSPKPGGNGAADDSSDSSGRPLGYTRDRLNDVVDRLRHTPRARSAPGDRYLDVSGQPPAQSQAGRDPYNPHHQPNHHQPQTEGRVAGPGHHPSERRGGPEDTSGSSGIGSRNTSQSTNASLRPPGGGPRGGEFMPAPPKPPNNAANSTSSLLTPQHESSLLEDDEEGSLPPPPLPPHHHHPHHHPHHPNNNRRDTSVDENYEFDDLPALEKDIRDDLSRYSRLAGSGRGRGGGGGSGGGGGGDGGPRGDMMRDLYPKPRRQSQYADAAERFQKLREEFQHFRQHQQQDDPQHFEGSQVPLPLYSMDSDML